MNRFDFEEDLSTEKMNKRSTIRKITLRTKPKITPTLFHFNFESEISSNNRGSKIEKIKARQSPTEIRPLSLKRMRESNKNNTHKYKNHINVAFYKLTMTLGKIINKTHPKRSKIQYFGAKCKFDFKQEEKWK